MSKKGIHILPEDEIKGNLFDEDNEEDNKELKKFQSLLSKSKETIIENDDDNNNDLNNKTNVSEKDNIYENENKDSFIKQKDTNQDDIKIETYLSDKISLSEDSNIEKKLEDNLEINNFIKNININYFTNDIESNNNKNINTQRQIINKNVVENSEFLLSKKEESDISKQNKEQKKKNSIFLIRKIKKRSKKIQFLRKKKRIQLLRKKDSDIIRKKIKTYFHNYLIEKLNFEIKSINWKKFHSQLDSHFSSKKVKKKRVNKFLKFNNKFTTNVSININKQLLLKKIYQILIDEPISSKYKAFHIKNNSYLAKYLLSIESNPHLKKILNSTYEECYKEFLKSLKFEKILENIKEKDGATYLNKFKKVAYNFTSFYNSKKNLSQKEKPKKKIFRIKHLNIDKEESKRSKKSKKSKKSISFFIPNKISSSSEENVFKNFSSYYFSNINSKNNIISLKEDSPSFNIFSKDDSYQILGEKSCAFKDFFFFNEIASFKDYEENINLSKEDILINDIKEINNLSAINKV